MTKLCGKSPSHQTPETNMSINPDGNPNGNPNRTNIFIQNGMMNNPQTAGEIGNILGKDLQMPVGLIDPLRNAPNPLNSSKFL